MLHKNYLIYPFLLHKPTSFRILDFALTRLIFKYYNTSKFSWSKFVQKRNEERGTTSFLWYQERIPASFLSLKKGTRSCRAPQKNERVLGNSAPRSAFLMLWYFCIQVAKKLIFLISSYLFTVLVQWQIIWKETKENQSDNLVTNSFIELLRNKKGHLLKVFVILMEIIFCVIKRKVHND